MFQLPVLIRIREGITVTLSQSVSQAVENDMPLRRVKEDIRKQLESGELKRDLVSDDYEVYGKASAISFWFNSGESLVYRVGQEFTQEDFDRVKAQLSSLNYKSKDERKPSNDKTADKA